MPIVGRRAVSEQSFQDIVGLRKKSVNEIEWKWEEIEVETNIFLSTNKFLTEKDRKLNEWKRKKIKLGVWGGMHVQPYTHLVLPSL